MALKEQLDEITEAWTEITKDYADKYEKALTDTLESLGLLDVDVYNKRTGSKGRLTIKKQYGYMSFNFVFTPYKKDGITLSSKYENLYIYTFSSNIEEDLMKTISKEAPDGKDTD